MCNCFNFLNNRTCSPFQNRCSPCNNQLSPVIIQRGPIGPQGPRGEIGPQGLTGATGATGATGPQGEIGPMSLSDSLFANGGAQTIANATIIPLSLIAQTTDSTMTYSTAGITLPDGYYIVNYGFSGSTATDGTSSIALYSNGTLLANSTISDAGALASSNKTLLYNATEGDVLSVYNVSGEELTLTDTYITITKIGD